MASAWGILATTDWTTVASLATAAGTLVLALATFASVRSATHTSLNATSGRPRRPSRAGIRLLA